MKRTELIFQDQFRIVIEHEKPWIEYQAELIAKHGMIVDFHILPEVEDGEVHTDNGNN